MNKKLKINFTIIGKEPDSFMSQEQYCEFCDKIEEKLRPVMDELKWKRIFSEHDARFRLVD